MERIYELPCSTSNAATDMKHLDLFSGIGGFALAVDNVWPGATHTFVELDPFCQAVLEKHWPESDIHADIRQFITDTYGTRGGASKCSTNSDGQALHQGQEEQSQSRTSRPIDILTGGFPCQPFSQAGRRKGTADDRYLWPEMFRVIQLYQPTWVIAENVRGLVTWNDGMVLEQVCADLESENYEVQPLIIPACAVNAPHRRDRVWIVANLKHNGKPRAEIIGTDSGTQPESQTWQELLINEHEGASGIWEKNTKWNADGGKSSTSDTSNERLERREQSKRQRHYGQLNRNRKDETQTSVFPDWSRDWREVALTTCHDGVDDGLPRRMGGLTISRARWRKEALKAYGNAIVPQVAMQIMKAIKESENL